MDCEVSPGDIDISISCISDVGGPILNIFQSTDLGKAQRPQRTIFTISTVDFMFTGSGKIHLF